jgi:class 3 adenylate cyclase
MPRNYRDPEYIARLEKRGLHLSGTVDLEHSPETLWPFLSNTDSLNARMGFLPVKYRFTEVPQGGTESVGFTFMYGFPFWYDDLPFEWVTNKYFIETRVFHGGPVSYLKVTTTLDPLPSGGTRVTFAFLLTVPWLFRLPMRVVFAFQLWKFLRIYRNLDKHVRSAVPNLFEAWQQDSAQAASRASGLEEQLKPLTSDPALAKTVAAHVFTTPEHQLSRIRPYELAAVYGHDRSETLRLFLAGTRAGLFDLKWSVLCPSCQGAKQSASTLGDLTGNTHCETCGIDYETNLAGSVELTFSPSARVRTVVARDYCFGNPSNTRHVWAQIPVAPRATRRVELALTPGQYRLRSLQMDGVLTFQADPLGESSLDVQLGAAFPEAADTRLAPAASVTFTNPRAHWTVVKLENLFWRNHAATADEVSNMQEFRDLYGAEVLRPGVHLAAANITILFSDLKDSTRMYQVWGDTSALGVVQDHFEVMIRVIREHHGSVVKTIGDAIMAGFTRPEDGMRAALAIQAEFARLNGGQFKNQPLYVKLGLHCGPAILLTLNERLDYFGTTVNKAARIQAQSQTDEIVISRELYDLPEVRALLPERPQAFDASLKGLEGSHRLYRIELAQDARQA